MRGMNWSEWVNTDKNKAQGWVGFIARPMGVLRRAISLVFAWTFRSCPGPKPCFHSTPPFFPRRPILFIMSKSLSPGEFVICCPTGSRGLFGSLGRSFGRSLSLERTALERLGTLIRYEDLLKSFFHAHTLFLLPIWSPWNWTCCFSNHRITHGIRPF